MKVRLLVMFALIALAGAHTKVAAQCKEMKWPEDRKKADECVAVWGDALKQGNYRSATSSIQWMLTNAPNWNTKLYIDAAEIYDKLADKEADAAKKKVLVDSLMMIYDMRIKSCGDEPNVLNRKVYAMYKYNIKNKEKVAELLGLYDKVFELNGNKVSDGNLVAYMTTVKANQIAFKNITEDQIFQRYDKISAIADAKIKGYQETNKADDVTKMKGIKEAVDGLLIGMVNVNCDFVRKNLAPKFKANPNDLALAKKIFSFMLKDKCTDDPLWLEAGEAIHKLNPEKDFGLVKALGAQYLRTGNIERGEALLKEAQTMAPTATDKGEILLYLGGIESKKGSYGSARELFRQAAAADPNNKDAWQQIGDLYYNSFDNCAKKQSIAEDRLVYLAAYEMYQRAGNAALMSRAKAQFPSREEIFLLNWTAGQSMKVGCWINEGVTLKTRD
jgi:tetratricopeptide (TPR) repeat protein